MYLNSVAMLFLYTVLLFHSQGYCATQWKTLKERFDSGLYASHADFHRLK